MTGPASVLFTNWAGFSARVEIQTPGAVSTDSTSSGQLLGRGTRLLYLPETGENTDTHRHPTGYSFIWDVAESRGYVLSEALQAYAPMAADLHVTNVVLDIGKGSAQRFTGHPCEPATATVRTADGTVAGFELLRAIDLKGFPVRIESATNVMAFTLTLSKAQLEQSPPDVFSPPEGFTKYATAEALADELAARQNNLRRKSPIQMQPMPELGQPGRY